MNIYEFIVKAYGLEKNLSPLNLYIELPEALGTYQVTKASPSRLELLDKSMTYKHLFKADRFSASSVSRKGSLVSSRTTIHLTRFVGTD